MTNRLVPLLVALVSGVLTGPSAAASSADASATWEDGPVRAPVPCGLCGATHLVGRESKE